MDNATKSLFLSLVFPSSGWSFSRSIVVLAPSGTATRTCLLVSMPYYLHQHGTLWGRSGIKAGSLAKSLLAMAIL